MKKLVALFLVICTLSCLMLVTGCNKKKGYDGNNFLTVEQATAEYGNPYRIVRDKVTIKIFVPRGSMNPHYEEMKMFKKLSEITNLELKFVEADTSSYTTLRSAAWMSGDLPDFFLFSNTMAEQALYSAEEALIPFNDPSLEVEGIQVGSLIDNYMPNYKRLLDCNFNIETDVNAKEVVTLPDGKMYATVSAKDVPRDLTYKMWINEQWIENINTTTGLKVKLEAEFGVSQLPTVEEINTIDELLLVLRAFKKLDANMNGNANDEIPASATKMDYLRNFLMAAYGAVSNSVEISNDGKSFGYTPASDAYREYLKTARMMYEEGLIDNSTFSILDNSQLAGNGYDNRLGVFCAAAAYLVVGYDLEANYTTFGPLTSNYYNGRPLHYGFTPFDPSASLIPAGTPYVREIARLMDIMYSDLGVQLISYGEEGVDWSWDNEEKTSWSFNVPESWEGTQEEYRATISPNVGTGACVYWQYDFVGKMNDPIITRLNKLSEIYLPYIKIPVPEDVILDATDYDSASLILDNLGKYIEMTESNFITGINKWNVHSDTDWNNYLNELAGYKYQDVVAMYNKALNR